MNCLGLCCTDRLGIRAERQFGGDYPGDKMRYIVYLLVSVDYWWGRLNLLNRLELGGEGVAKWVERQYGRMAWEISGEFLGRGFGTGLRSGSGDKMKELKL